MTQQEIDQWEQDHKEDIVEKYSDPQYNEIVFVMKDTTKVKLKLD